MVETFAVDCSGLVLDMTNFATYIDSGNDRAPIAQRGHAKQKRTDLRIVGLGLVVSTDVGVPLVSHAYPGNRPDVTQFPEVVAELVERFGAAGRIGRRAHLGLRRRPGLDRQPGAHGGQPAALRRLAPTIRSPATSWRWRRAATGSSTPRPSRACPHSKPALRSSAGTAGSWSPTRSACTTQQVHGFEQTLSKARRQLTEITARLGRGKGRKTKEKVSAEIASMLKPRWLDRVVSVTLSGDEPSKLRLSWRTKPKAITALADELFGKRILFTDRDEWSIAEVVTGYRSQSQVEADFRQMKDPRVVSFSPMFHFTDQKIRTHVAHCVLALMTARLMAREAAHAGMPMSVRELLSRLAGIEETVLLYQGDRGRPRARRMLTEMDPAERRLYDLFGLHAYAPTR